MSFGVSAKVIFYSKIIKELKKDLVLYSIKLGAKKSGIDFDFERNYILRKKNEIVFGLRDCPLGWHADSLFAGDLSAENLMDLKIQKDQYGNSLYQSLETRMCRVRQLLEIILKNNFIEKIILIVDEEAEVDRTNGYYLLESIINLDDFVSFMLLAYKKEDQYFPSLNVEIKL